MGSRDTRFLASSFRASLALEGTLQAEPYVSPHDQRLWAEFKEQMISLLPSWATDGAPGSGPIIFQCDNRGRGYLGTDQDLNAAA